MLRATLTGMMQRKLRSFLSGLAVVLGVMFVAGALLLTDTLQRSFDEVFADAFSEVDVLVQGEPNVEIPEDQGEQIATPIPDDTVDRVAEVPGVAEAAGEVEQAGARLIGSDGSVVPSFGPPRLGTNWQGESDLIQLRDGRGPTADDEVAIDAALAEAADVGVGERTGVLTLEPRREVTIVGIFGFSGGRDSLGGTQMVAFTDAAAQELMLGETGVWSGVAVTTTPDATPEQVRDDIAATLGDGYEVATGDELAEENAQALKEGLSFFSYILLGFAGIALFVGVFLILNTFSIIVAQRTRELALTRALGAGRLQVVGSVLLEAVIIGLLASAVGLAAGVGVGALLATLVGTFMSLPVAGLTLTVGTVVAAFTVGTLVTVVAAVVPALRASRVSPVAAMQEATSAQRPLTRLTVTGAVVGAAGAALLVAGLTSNANGADLWAILGGVLLVFIAVALLTPLVVRPVVAVIGRLFSWSVPGQLGRLNSGRNPLRTAITASALMIGVALVSGVGVVVASAQTSMRAVAEDSIAADLVISGDQVGPTPPAFDAAVLEQTAELDGVDTAAGLYQEQAEVGGERRFVTAATDLPALRQALGLTPQQGQLTALADDELVVDSDTAADHDLTVGDRVPVQTTRGEARDYEVVGLYESEPYFSGFVLPPAASADFAVPQPAMGFVQLTDGAAADDVQATVSQLLTDSPEVSVADQSSYIDQQLEQLDFVVLTVQALLALAILIAVLGIVNTLALSVLERTRELGLLRAVGLSRAATVRMVTVESVVISLFGALLGVVVGTGLGAAVTRALADEGISDVALPWGDLSTYLVLAAVVGVVAAVLPAIRAARVDVLRAVTVE